MTRRTLTLAKTSRPGFTHVIPREHLFARCDDAIGHRALWVSGPPGSGKTTLLSSFLEARDVASLWYQLDASDADPTTFLSALSRAARSSRTRRGADKDKGMNEASCIDVPASSTNAHEFFSALFARFDERFVIVFDNCQDLAATDSFRETIDSALEVLPRVGCLAFLSRGDPPPSMARLLVGQSMARIGWDELRLTDAEVGELASLRGLELDGASFGRLCARTQGWAAGVVLIVEHSRLGAGLAGIDTDDAPPLMFEFLAGESFDRFEPAAREFLLTVAWLPSMTEMLAESLTRSGVARSMLRNLVRNDYFVSERVTEGERVYQIHPLFREFLQARAIDTLAAERVEAIRRSAANALEAEGEIEGAARVLIDAAQQEALAALVLRHAPELIAQARHATLAAWIAHLPASLVDADPWLLLWQARSAPPDALREARRLLERARRRFAASPQPPTEGLIACCTAAIENILLEFDDLALLDDWLDALQCAAAKPRTPPSGVADRASVVSTTATALRRPELLPPPALPGAGRALEGAVIELATMWTRNRLSGDEPAGAPPAAAGIAASADALRELLTGHWDQVEERARAFIDVHASGAAARLQGPVCAAAAAASLCAGRRENATIWLDRVVSPPAAANRLDRCLRDLVCAWCALAAGDALEAFRAAHDAHAVSVELGVPPLEGVCRACLVESLLATGDRQRASDELARLLDHPGCEAVPLTAVLAHLASAQLHLEPEDEDRVLAALSRALAIGREHGLGFVSVSRPWVLSRLLARALEAGIEVPYATALIKRYGLTPARDARVPAWPWSFRLRTLGRFQLTGPESDDQLIALHGRPVDLLKVLVSLGGQDVSVERISEALWPHVDGDYAYKSFSTALYRLRHTLGRDDALVLREGRLSLEPSLWWLDVWTLETVFDEVESAFRAVGLRAAPDCERLARKLLAAHPGAFLNDDAGHAQYVARRDQLRTRFARNVSRIAQCMEETGHTEGAVDLLEQAINADRGAERLYRNLMLSLDRAGRQAEAREVYELCRTTLMAMLGTEPAPETVAIYKRIAIA